MASHCGVYAVRFYRDDERVTYIRTYRVPSGRRALGILHRYMVPVKDQVDDGFALASGDAGCAIQWPVYDKGKTPLWAKVGNAFCGHPTAWAEGAVVGVDPPLSWTHSGLSTCCIKKGTVPVPLTLNRVPKATGAGDELVDSRITDPGVGGVAVAAPLSIWGSLSVLANGPALGSLLLRSVIDATGGYGLLTQDGGVASGYTAAFHFSASGNTVTFDFGSIGAGADVQLAIQGEVASTIAADGWDVRSGLVFGVPSAGDIATALGLGSAAYEDAAAFLALAANLADLADPADARANLGLGSAAVEDTSAFLALAANLADLADPADARDNLGLGSAAVEDTTAFQPSGGTRVRAHLTGTPGLTASTWLTVVFDSETTDAEGEYDPTTGTFTPDESGDYLVSWGAVTNAACTRLVGSMWEGTTTEFWRFSTGVLEQAGGCQIVPLTAGTGYVFRVFTPDALKSLVAGESKGHLNIRRVY